MPKLLLDPAPGLTAGGGLMTRQLVPIRLVRYFDYKALKLSRLTLEEMLAIEEEREVHSRGVCVGGQWGMPTIVRDDDGNDTGMIRCEFTGQLLPKES
jgi:hypothetical protein